MNWKEFFRPNRLILIIFLIISLFEFYLIFTGRCVTGGKCDWKYQLMNFISPMMILRESIFDKSILNLFLFLVVDGIIIYVISCVINFIIKLKKSK